MEREVKDLRTVLQGLLRVASNFARDAHTHVRDADKAEALVSGIGEQVAALRKNDSAAHRSVERLDKAVHVVTDFLREVEEKQTAMSRAQMELDAAVREIERIK